MRSTPRAWCAIWLAGLLVTQPVSDARAWSPPDGPAPDQAERPATPTTLLAKTHGYIIQNGISILHTDGYWFAADTLREWQQELLNGVRYADTWDGRQKVVLKACALLCWDVWDIRSWPRAGDDHYFNPDTGSGFDPGALDDIETWWDFINLDFLPDWARGLSLTVTVEPSLAGNYQSALVTFEEAYTNALNVYRGFGAPGVGDREGEALGMFYMGWASHLLQDLTVVHHTFDAFLDNHDDYEGYANGKGVAPVADGRQKGIYYDQLPPLDCQQGSRRCLLEFAAEVSHKRAILSQADDNHYQNAVNAARFAETLQAGLYAAFLTDIGRPPVHMSAVMPAL